MLPISILIQFPEYLKYLRALRLGGSMRLLEKAEVERVHF